LRDKNICGFEIAVNHAALMGVLNSIGNQKKKIDAIDKRWNIPIAELDKWEAIHKIHHEIWEAVVRATGIKNARDVGMVCSFEGALLNFKPSGKLGIDRSMRNDFYSNLAMDRFQLLCEEDDSAAACADSFDDSVWPDVRGHVQLRRKCGMRSWKWRSIDRGGIIRNVVIEKRLDFAAQGFVVRRCFGK
jgi:hypothetical protein